MQTSPANGYQPAANLKVVEVCEELLQDFLEF